jgi:hypothetical protein
MRRSVLVLSSLAGVVGLAFASPANAATSLGQQYSLDLKTNVQNVRVIDTPRNDGATQGHIGATGTTVKTVCLTPYSYWDGKSPQYFYITSPMKGYVNRINLDESKLGPKGLAEMPECGQSQTNADQVNVRTEPNTKSKIIRTIPRRYSYVVTTCDVKGESIQGETTWLYSPSEGGYISGHYLTWPRYLAGQCG